MNRDVVHKSVTNQDRNKLWSSHYNVATKGNWVGNRLDGKGRLPEKFRGGDSIADDTPIKIDMSKEAKTKVEITMIGLDYSLGASTDENKKMNAPGLTKSIKLQFKRVELVIKAESQVERGYVHQSRRGPTAIVVTELTEPFFKEPIGTNLRSHFSAYGPAL
ncbi:hypothetical protein BY996DRAFT_6527673 [Phakopsora pachyrhizi]|nr:hypothetical protein BY996DRAFT_6527673 [Phakopsora pachyrhizi]